MRQPRVRIPLASFPLYSPTKVQDKYAKPGLQAAKTELTINTTIMDIGEWMGVSTVEAGRQAIERGEFRQAVWEATSIKDPP